MTKIFSKTHSALLLSLVLTTGVAAWGGTTNGASLAAADSKATTRKAGSARASATTSRVTAKKLKHTSNEPAIKPDTTAGAVKPQWLGVQEGLALGRAQHKPVLVDVYTDWCSWCHRMEQTTLRDPQVMRTLASNYVLVRANAEDGGAGQSFAQQLRIEGYPTFVLIDANGVPKTGVAGYKTTEEFLPIITNFLKQQ